MIDMTTKSTLDSEWSGHTQPYNQINRDSIWHERYGGFHVPESCPRNTTKHNVRLVVNWIAYVCLQ